MLKWSLYQRSIRTKSNTINHSISSNGKSTVSTVCDVVVVNLIRIAYGRFVSGSESDLTFVCESLNNSIRSSVGVWILYSPTHTSKRNILTVTIDVALFKWLDISPTHAQCQRMTDLKHHNVANRINRLVKRLAFFKWISVLTVTMLLLNCPLFNYFLPTNSWKIWLNL
jgi:hypothetical protein